MMKDVTIWKINKWLLMLPNKRSTLATFILYSRKLKDLAPFLTITFLMISIFFKLTMAAGHAEGGGSTETQLKFQIKLDKKRYRSLEPITIECRMTNTGKKVVTIKPRLYNDELIYLKHEDDQVEYFFDSNILIRQRFRPEGIIKLSPGETSCSLRIIDKTAYTMPNKLGRYELYLVYRNLRDELWGIKFWTGKLKSNVVKFEIKN